MATAVREVSLWSRGPRLAVALLGTVIVIGTLGYRLIEGWAFWDAFYMTVTTVATVPKRTSVISMIAPVIARAREVSPAIVSLLARKTRSGSRSSTSLADAVQGSSVTRQPRSRS